MHKEQIDEMVEGLKLEYERVRKLVEDLEPLVKSEGWKQYQQLLEVQIAGRVGSGNRPTPTKGMEGVLEREFANGEVAGLMLAKELPEAVLSGAKDLLDEYRKQSVSIGEQMSQSREGGDSRG